MRYRTLRAWRPDGVRTGDEFGLGYCTSKAAVIQLSNTVALEYQEYGIRVNSIILGQTKGDTHVGVLRKYAEYLDLPNPSGAVRLHDEAPKLDPVTIGRFLALLALDDAAVLTGATIALDQGTSADGALSNLTDVVVRQYCEPVSDVGTTTTLTDPVAVVEATRLS